MQSQGKEHGEGNYEASREYNEATRRFVDSGKVDDAARAAEPRDAAEAAELESAEAQGLARAKEEDPEVLFGSDEAQDDASAAAADGDGDGSEDDPEGVRVTDRPADATSTPAPGRAGS